MKKKLILKKELKKIISKNITKKKIIISTRKKYLQISKNSFLLNKFNKKELKFPLFYKELKKDLSDFFFELNKTTDIFCTEYLVIKSVGLLKRFYLNNTNCLNKLVNIIGNKKSNLIALVKNPSRHT